MFVSTIQTCSHLVKQREHDYAITSHVTNHPAATRLHLQKACHVVYLELSFLDFTTGQRTSTISRYRASFGGIASKFNLGSSGPSTTGNGCSVLAFLSDRLAFVIHEGVGTVESVMSDHEASVLLSASSSRFCNSLANSSSCIIFKTISGMGYRGSCPGWFSYLE